MFLPEAPAEHARPDLGIPPPPSHPDRHIIPVKQDGVQDLPKDLRPLIARAVRQFEGGDPAMDALPDAAHADVALIGLEPSDLLCIARSVHGIVLVAETQIVP